MKQAFRNLLQTRPFARTTSPVAFRKRSSRLLIAMATLFISLARGQEALTAVAPPSAINEEGRGAAFPFCCRNAFAQFLYNGSNFTNAMPRGGRITEIAFRVDGPNGNPVDATINDVEIYLFTTEVRAEEVKVGYPFLSGPHRTLVFGRKNLLLRSSWTPSGPNPFMVKIPLAQEFAYCPLFGSLVIEIHQYGDPTGTAVGIDNADGSSDAWLNGSPFGRNSAPVVQVTFIPGVEKCLSISIRKEEDHIILISSDGGVIETTGDLASEAWIEVGPAPQRVNLTNSLKFFRVRKEAHI